MMVFNSVTDAVAGNLDTGDFRDGNKSGSDYDYWLDGSLKRDRNKKIASITYNYLKLPEVITFDDNKTITTEYDAEGTKLKKIVSGGETTDYEEDDIYVNGKLYQTSHDEGRIVDGIYEYNITDHNNDLRIAFKDSLGFAVPTQSIFYDPWGLSMKGMQITRNPLNFNKYQFLNRETQFETGYIDLLRRQFDPQTGRFTSQDPVIEGQEHLSLYQYGWNNPVLKPDPNGDCPKCGDFLNGVGNGFVGAFKAIGNAIAHPINTYNNAAQSSTAAFKADPVGFVVDNAISSSPVNSVREGYEFGKALAAGNSFGAGEMAGGKIAEVAIAAATEGAGRAVGAIGKGAGAEAVSLETRASEIHGTVSKATQSRTTIAVADAVNAEGKSVRIVGSSETKLRPAQRSMLNSNEVAASGPGHAEVTVLNHASKNGMTVGNIAASRPICPSCATSIQSAGATAKSVLKVVKDQ